MIQCPICHKIEADIQESRLNLYRCNNCTHTFTVIPKDEEECYEEDYFIKVHKNWFDNPNYQLFNFVYSELAKLTRNKRVQLLDVGCGRGDFLKYLASKNSKYKLFGIDLTDNQYPGIHFIKGDFLKEDMGNKFDIICSFMVVEHINDPHLFIEKIGESLKPGGFVFINTINNGSLMYRIARMLNRVGVHVVHDRFYSYHHLHHYTNQSLKILMEMNGFDVLFKKNHNYPMNAVDVPESNFLINEVSKFLVWLIFIVSEPSRLGMHQTIICRKKSLMISGIN